MIRASLSTQPGAPSPVVTWDQAKAFLLEPSDGAVLWVDVAEASEEDVLALERVFALHPLTVEDLTHRNQRAKLEEYPEYLFAVLHWFSDLTKKASELHCILGKHYLLTVVDGRTIAPVEEAWQEFLRGHGRPPHGADGQLYRLLDRVVDGHVPLLTSFEDRLEHLAATETDFEKSTGHVVKVVSIRRGLVRFRRILAPQRDLLNAIARRDFGLISERTVLYFRDVADHCQRAYESLESLRELVQSIMEVQIAVSERRQNLIVKRLTLISTIFLPLNFITGFFGQNFEILPFTNHALFYAALLSMVALPGALLALFYRKRWV